MNKKKKKMGSSIKLYCSRQMYTFRIYLEYSEARKVDDNCDFFFNKCSNTIKFVSKKEKNAMELKVIGTSQ